MTKVSKKPTLPTSGGRYERTKTGVKRIGKPTAPPKRPSASKDGVTPQVTETAITEEKES